MNSLILTTERCEFLIFFLRIGALTHTPSAINPSVPVLIYSDMPENVQSFKREREREDKRKRKKERERDRERERVDRHDAICKRKRKRE